MRLTTPLLSEVRNAPAQGRGFEPKTSLIAVTARVLGDTAATSVSASMSVYGQIKEGEGQRPYAPEPISFGGASIISFSGTGSAQWGGSIENCLYSNITASLISLSTLTSFQASATEAEL